MAKSLTAPISIINFIECAFSIIIGGLMGDLPMAGTYPKLQVINAVAYGYIIINIIVIAAGIMKEEISKNLRLIIAASAFVLYIVCGALILEFFDKNETLLKFDDEKYGRTLTAGIFSIALAALYAIDVFFVYKKS